MKKALRVSLLTLNLTLIAQAAPEAVPSEPLPGTQLLTMQGDIASNLVAGADRFLLKELENSVRGRESFFHRDLSSADAYTASLNTNRQRLASILGVRDARANASAFEAVSSVPAAGPVARGAGYEIYAVRWGAFGEVHGAGLLLLPTNGVPAERVIAVPDADQTPEQLVGLAEGVAADSQFARRLAESGCLVVVPALVNRHTGEVKAAGAGDRGAALSNREFIYRPAYELGRHVIGYEVEEILAAVDLLQRVDAGLATARSGGGAPSSPARVGVMGWGEGGLLALAASALDPRIQAVCVSGYFERREAVWEEPIYRNVFGLLEQFGDAEFAAMVAPRTLIVEACRGPEVTVPVGTSGGPGRLRTPGLADVRGEFERAQQLVAGLKPAWPAKLAISGDGTGAYGSTETLASFLTALNPASALAELGAAPVKAEQDSAPATRHSELMRELNQHTQNLLVESPYTRQKFMERLDTSSPDRYESSAAIYRDLLYREVIGRFERPLLPPNPRSRKVLSEESWDGYEVVLDVFPDVIAYGLLLVPKDIKPGEHRPVVVCQHGLEGRPQDTVGKPGFEYYKAFASELAKQGFITFAPQNLYIFTDRFRTLQRKANPLKKTLYSIIVPQHQQITDWLKGLPFVDPARIGFYGLSYGGKTAMRVPSLVTNYCLSICSGDFNEWVWKNASTRSPYSYAWGGEYEIFEFDLGSTFNYAEMAALIAPRPFMVERGHFDGVAPDETVAFEFAKVRHLYEARLHLENRCEIEWFTGPHTINGKGTFRFLQRNLDWTPR